MIYRIIISLCIISTFTVACKKKKDNPEPQVINKGPEVKSMKDVRLYNQFINTNNLFSISDSTFIEEQSANFDICYSNIAIGDPAKNYFVLGSPADKNYTDKAYSNLTSSNVTTFYTVPVSFTYANFDTLRYSSNLQSFIENNCSIIYSNMSLQLAQAVRSDDSYGWGANTIFAIKTAAGKYGLLKIIAAPTGSATETDPSLKGGLIKLDIKIEK